MATTTMPALLATMGAGSATLGIIEGLADGLSSFAKLASGLYSDKLPKRKFLAVIGYFMTASGMASFSIATRPWHVLLGRTGGWLGRGVRTPVRNVLLSDATTPETYGKAFGLERAMDSAGAIVGPALSLALASRIGIRSVFALTLIPGIAAALVIALLVREKSHEPQVHQRLFSGMNSLPREFKRFLFGVGIAGLGDFSNTLLILWAIQAWSSRFGVHRASMLAMLFYVGYNVVYTLTCYLSGSLADHFQKKTVLAVGYFLAIIPAAALIFPGTSFVKFAIVFGFSGLYMGVWETVESASAASLLPREIKGIGFGTLATVNGIGDLFSSVVVGALWAVSPLAAMGFVILSSAVGAGAILTTPPVSVG